VAGEARFTGSHDRSLLALPADESEPRLWWDPRSTTSAPGSRKFPSATSATGTQPAQRASDRAEAGTPLDERRLLLFSVRATRLLRALERDQPDDATTDPVLAAARDAVGLATALISYRQAAEHMEDQLPEEFLQMTTALFKRIGETFLRLSS
jgi:hypothetical protein